MKRSVVLCFLAAAIVVAFKQSAIAQAPTADFFLAETFQLPQGAEEVPVTQANIVSPNLEVHLYGPGAPGLLVVKHANRDEPTYVWSGTSAGAWVLTLRDRKFYVDLSGPDASIKWSTKMAGKNLLRPVLKLADGTFLVGDYTEGSATDWHVSEIRIASVKWRSMAEDTALPTQDGFLQNPPHLTRVTEVGG